MLRNRRRKIFLGKKICCETKKERIYETKNERKKRLTVYYVENRKRIRKQFSEIQTGEESQHRN